MLSEGLQDGCSECQVGDKVIIHNITTTVSCLSYVSVGMGWGVVAKEGRGGGAHCSQSAPIEIIFSLSWPSYELYSLPESVRIPSCAKLHARSDGQMIGTRDMVVASCPQRVTNLMYKLLHVKYFLLRGATLSGKKEWAIGR